MPRKLKGEHDIPRKSDGIYQTIKERLARNRMAAIKEMQVSVNARPFWCAASQLNAGIRTENGSRPVV